MKNKEQKSFKEIAEILKRFDIDGITEEMIHELEASCKAMPVEVELNKTAMLLSVLGAGIYFLPTTDIRSASFFIVTQIGQILFRKKPDLYFHSC